MGESIAHKICYCYMKSPPMKCHQDFVDMTQRWETLSTDRRRYLLDEKRTKGFRKPSLITDWPKMNSVDAFFIDVMHMLDDGVSRCFLSRIVEGGAVAQLTKTEIKKIDTL